MRMFVQLGESTDINEIIKIKTALLECCKFDTYAMARILEKSKELVK
jgi:hypothetical protein